jgi:hypothetical protein
MLMSRPSDEASGVDGRPVQNTDVNSLQTTNDIHPLWPKHGDNRALVARHPWKERNKKGTVLLRFGEEKKVSHVGRNYSNTQFAPAHGRIVEPPNKKISTETGGLEYRHTPQEVNPYGSQPLRHTIYIQLFAHHSYHHV